MLTAHYSPAAVAVLLPRATIQTALTSGTARTFGCTNSYKIVGSRSLIVGGAAFQDHYLPTDKQATLYGSAEGRSQKAKSRESLSFQGTTSALKSNLGS